MIEPTFEGLGERMMQSGRGMTNTHAVDAALEAMPYGLCVWSEDLTLQVFNSRYAWTFGLAPDTLTAGMSLRACCRAVIEAGNYFGYSVDELYEAMVGRFERQKRQDAPTQYEQFLRDRNIRTTYTNRPGGRPYASRQPSTTWLMACA